MNQGPMDQLRIILCLRFQLQLLILLAWSHLEHKVHLEMGEFLKLQNWKKRTSFLWRRKK